MGDQPIARPLPAYRTAQTQNKRAKTSMPQVGFEPTIPVFEWEKTATVIGDYFIYYLLSHYEFCILNSVYAYLRRLSE
jgi:hypothetical protein